MKYQSTERRSYVVQVHLGDGMWTDMTPPCSHFEAHGIINGIALDDTRSYRLVERTERVLDVRGENRTAQGFMTPEEIAADKTLIGSIVG